MFYCSYNSSDRAQAKRQQDEYDTRCAWKALLEKRYRELGLPLLAFELEAVSNLQRGLVKEKVNGEEDC